MLAITTAIESSATHSSTTSCVGQEGLKGVECDKSGWVGSEVAQQKPHVFWLLFRLPCSPPYPPTPLPASKGERDRQGLGKKTMETQRTVDFEHFRRKALFDE